MKITSEIKSHGRRSGLGVCDNRVGDVIDMLKSGNARVELVQSRDHSEGINPCEACRPLTPGEYGASDAVNGRAKGTGHAEYSGGTVDHKCKSQLVERKHKGTGLLDELRDDDAVE